MPCTTSARARSSAVSAVMGPPDSETWRITPPVVPPKTIMPPGLHAPLPIALADATVQIGSTGPPSIATFFIAAPTVNPTNLPSGDQKMDTTPSVPAIARASTASTSRIHSRMTLSASRAVKAIRRPSGETASPSASVFPDGGWI